MNKKIEQIILYFQTCYSYLTSESKSHLNRVREVCINSLLPNCQAQAKSGGISHVCTASGETNLRHVQPISTIEVVSQCFGPLPQYICTQQKKRGGGGGGFINLHGLLLISGLVKKAHEYKSTANDVSMLLTMVVQTCVLSCRTRY